MSGVKKPKRTGVGIGILQVEGFGLVFGGELGRAGVGFLFGAAGSAFY